MSRYRCVDTQRAEGFPVAAACVAAGVSASAYYAWAARPAQTAAERDTADLVERIRQVHSESGGTYGAPRVTRELRRQGRRVNRKRVERLMRRHGLVGHRPRRRRSLTRPDEVAAPIPDLVGRLFNPDRLDRTWVGDVTYVPTDEGWLYLASVLDLGSRRLLGWSMGERHHAGLVVGALDAAVAARGLVSMHGTIFHTDRGSEYTSAACAAACARRGLQQSMGRVGSCFDNAAAESFFATLKVELVDRQHYKTKTDARQAIFRWIAYYNHRRLHSTCGYLPPIEYEQRFHQHVLESTPAA